MLLLWQIGSDSIGRVDGLIGFGCILAGVLEDDLTPPWML